MLILLGAKGFLRKLFKAKMLFALISLAPFLPVTDFQPEAYLGRWYQTYSDLAVDATFENSSYCVTADYSMNDNGTIAVENRERQFSVNGPERRILGWAEPATNDSALGEYTVHLQTTNSAFGAPYWIYDLGPQQDYGENQTQYAYAIVSDPLDLTLFVLARNVTEFHEVWEPAVLARLEANGFNSWLNSPIATVQEGCSYF